MKKSIIYLMMLVALLATSGCGGGSDSESATPTQTETEAEASVTIVVRSQDGALLNAASVSLDEVSGSTDEEGQVNLETSLFEEAVVRVNLEGFVNQSVITAVTEITNLQVIMIPVKEVINLTNIQAAQEIKASELNAKITLPNNALVDINGNPAEGNVTLNITPWDITNSDITAMLGNGQALTADNERVELISAGMMSVSFYDAQGNYLQLAPDTTAQIQMDLPYASINNIALAEGDKIPLWYFDEKQGLWLEEGEGTVVYSATSPVSLAVQADVPHFSTWNWDFKWQNGGSVTVKCINSDQSATTCNVVAYVKLADDSYFTKSATIPVEGFTVINMPTSATIVWVGTKNGLIGVETSTTQGAVVIQLEAPVTNNFVQCKMQGKATACTVSLETDDYNTLEFSVPASGATIQTALPGVTSIKWTARSGNFIEDSTIFNYTGQTSTNNVEAVNINLETREEVRPVANTILVGCVNNQYTSATTCDITITEDNGVPYAKFYNILINQHAAVTLPDNIQPNSNLYITVEGKDANGNYEGYGDQNIDYITLTDGQIIDIRLNYGE